VVLRAASSGGGPAPEAVRAQLGQLDAQRQLIELQIDGHRQHLARAAAELPRAVTTVTEPRAEQAKASGR
jgi:hypothetical protein